MRGRIGASFADAYTNARDKHLPELYGCTAQRGHETPQRYRESNEVAAVASVCPHGHGHAKRGIEQSKHDPGQQTQLSIADLESLLYGLLQNGDDLSINVAGGEDQHQ